MIEQCKYQSQTITSSEVKKRLGLKKRNVWKFTLANNSVLAQSTTKTCNSIVGVHIIAWVKIASRNIFNPNLKHDTCHFACHVPLFQKCLWSDWTFHPCSDNLKTQDNLILGTEDVVVSFAMHSYACKVKKRFNPMPRKH